MSPASCILQECGGANQPPHPEFELKLTTSYINPGLFQVRVFYLYKRDFWQNICNSLHYNPLKLNTMKQKKSPNANLEKQRSTFFQIGLVISLVLVLLAFECTRTTGELKIISCDFNMDTDDDLVIKRTWREKPEPKIEPIKI